MILKDRTILGALVGAIVGIVAGSFVFPEIPPSIEALVCGLGGALIFRYLWRY
jgi:hypothetical protein